MQSVVDATDLHIPHPREDDDFGITIMNQQLKTNILQHLFSYQEKGNVKIFDLYLEHIKLGRGVKTVFNHIFYRYFSEINAKNNSEFGVCIGCIDKFGYFEKRTYKKILESFPKDN